jgi:hypothetical protein
MAHLFLCEFTATLALGGIAAATPAMPGFQSNAACQCFQYRVAMGHP